MALEAKIPQNLGHSTWMNTDKLVKRSNGFLRLSEINQDKWKLQMAISRQPKRNLSPPALDVSCSYNKYPASVQKSRGFPATLDESLILKVSYLRVFICYLNRLTLILQNKSEEVGQYLNGRCIYLVGMMGSGKTTIGRILADVLGYSFFDSDVLVEHAVGGSSVAEIFKLHGEGFFRDNETEVLQKLSSQQQLVISTGGGAVVRPINWKYMRSGVSVWLDVPLEALVRRITAVGTNSRPLLHEGPGDVYSRTFMRLSNIMEERGEAYANANARVCLDSIAAKFGYLDVCNLSPVIIAIEALEQIGHFLKEDGSAM
ncbi:hypothetical protein V2J09_021680 [Rumex salicifolius]